MFKLYHINKGEKTEILPENGIYIVYELYEYNFTYTGNILDKTIFIEDEILDGELVKEQLGNIALIEGKRIFEDHFGYVTLVINGQSFNCEVRIQKLKVPELEEILLYLWNQEPLIFDNFFSKSSIKAKLDSLNTNLNFSSKFINIFEDFYSFFKSKYFVFKSLPHYVIRSKDIIQNYSDAEISSNSIDWLLTNFDQLNFDHNYKNIDNSIKIGNNYCMVEKILTSKKTNDFNVYENQIILGSFDFVQDLIKRLKNIIQSRLVDTPTYNTDYYSINELKIIPFIKLKNDVEKIGSKIKYLKTKYEEIFPNTKSKSNLPRLTSVFSNKKHYSEAYNKIKLIRDLRFNLEGEMRLLNIKKVSTLYERFNLYVLINSLLIRRPLSFKKSAICESEIFHKYCFSFNNAEITLFYDFYIGNGKNETGLQRISLGHYKPDYVIKIETKGNIFFYILDSKYSSYSTVKNNHSNKCIKSYILDIGVSEQYSQKADELILIYPGDKECILYGSKEFKPKISMIPSKVKFTNLEKFVNSLFSTF